MLNIKLMQMAISGYTQLGSRVRTDVPLFLLGNFLANESKFSLFYR